jgi:hypothetical protein
VSGDHAGGGRDVPNALRDQAIPNILPATEGHPAPTGRTDEGDHDHPARAERWEQDAASTPDAKLELGEVAGRLCALAHDFATRSEAVEARLLEDFRSEAAPLAQQCGELVIRDADAERVWFQADGSFSGEVVLEEAPTSWRPLNSARDIVNAFDPSELFAELANRLAQQFPIISSPDGDNAGPRLRQLAEAFAERGRSRPQQSAMREVGLIEQFEEMAAPFASKIGDIIFLDDADERVTLGRDGRFLAEVVPEDDESSWRTLRTSEQLTEFYGPDELFKALADELGRAYPAAANEGPDAAAGTLRELALLWQGQALDAEATLFEEFSEASVDLGRALGEFAIVDDDDEQLIVGGDGQLRARVLDRSIGVWREIASPDELVESYDPTDVFSDLADALADAFPALAARVR